MRQDLCYRCACYLEQTLPPPPVTQTLSLSISGTCRLFGSLRPLFRTPAFCFQQLPASFSKTPGVGVPSRIASLESASSSLFSLVSASPQPPLRLGLIISLLSDPHESLSECAAPAAVPKSDFA